MICFDYYCGHCGIRVERIVRRSEADSQLCLNCGDILTKLLTFSKANARPDVHAFPVGYWETADRHFSSRRELEDYIERSGENDPLERRQAKYLDGYRGRPRPVSMGESNLHGGTSTQSGDE